MANPLTLTHSHTHKRQTVYNCESTQTHTLTHSQKTNYVQLRIHAHSSHVLDKCSSLYTLIARVYTGIAHTFIQRASQECGSPTKHYTGYHVLPYKLTCTAKSSYKQDILKQSMTKTITAVICYRSIIFPP